MAPIIRHGAGSAHVLLSDVTGRMAKADIRKPDTVAYYAELGECCAEVARALGLTLKEFAFELGKDERQVSRWIDGTDRPQIEVVFAVERFRAPLVIALAQKSAGVETVTTITVRRTA